MPAMFAFASSFAQDLGWCVDDDVDLTSAFHHTPCASTSCGVKQVAGGCAPTSAPTPVPTPAPTTPAPTTSAPTAPTPPPTVTPRKNSSSRGGPILFKGDGALLGLLFAVGACYFCCRRDKADEPSSANPEPTELPPPDEESLETRAAAKAKAAETAERPGFARKLSSFLFGEQEEEPTALAVAEAEEAPPAEQPPPTPTPAEPAAPKAEEMYNQIAAWYNEPGNAALRATWGAYPDPDDFQTWSGFVAVTNAFLDREAG